MVLTKIVGGCPAHSAGNMMLPLGPKKPNHTLQLQLHPFSSGVDADGLIVKVQPPREPEDTTLRHVPCDLVLSIDVSESMGSPAPAPTIPGEEAEEDSGLSVLDLVKHAARTIVETLDARDRLGIVTFTTNSKVLQPLTAMTDENKAETLKKIDSMQPLNLTNLWHGIRDGLGLFLEGEDGQPGSTGRVPALLVLTDGVPTYMCPPRGYIPQLRTMEPLPATIHTFGFGYSLKSGLLKSIAEIGGGNYSFIPDAGMLGTVFIHAVANLQSTFANNAKLRLTYPSYLKLEETTGEAVGRQEPVELGGDFAESLTSLTILLDNLQYGQSRDIYLRYGSPTTTIQAAAKTSTPPILTAVVEYQHFTPTIHQAVAHQHALTPSLDMDPAERAYHISRAALIAFLSTLSPLNAQREHEPLKTLPSDLPHRLLSLRAHLPASSNPAHPGCRSLLTDLCGTTSDQDDDSDDPSTWTGQIALALLDKKYYRRWGAHYLASLAGAHARQACNSFRDAGPLLYGADSPLFETCRGRLDKAFDSLPPPRPSLPRQRGKKRGGGNGNGGVASMSRYNDVRGGCFAGCVGVLLAGGKGVVRVGRLRRGMEVVTPRGPRKVVGVLRMPVRRAEMCLVGRLLVTPWHPVASPSPPREGGVWKFPRDVAVRSVRYMGAVYSVLLERDEDADAHAVLVGGMWGVTMGHGLTQADKGGDVRVHQFYGDYDKVSTALTRLPTRSGGVALGGGLTRDPDTGLINGFSAVEAAQAKPLAMDKIKGDVYARI
ncbi:hint-domain-containing protein [Parachaetomium inaequale]|uniref:Hint-domain-containing protein n=1 Tax=Parachaetomium inaequale TaxID=2588326 RepID=A0AAN6P7Q3_9PEZI|nr:hint-domain-containing protein [Parachaetomium inaequale]